MRSYIGYITEITPIKDGCMFTLRCFGYSVVVVAGAGIDAEMAISANIFIDYAFDVLGDGVYDLCIEILKEKGLWKI